MTDIKQLQVVETAALGSVEKSSTPGQHRFKIRVIEGDRWGSSGYYAAAMLASEGPKTFVEGTQMYLNHPSWSDEFDQPERRVQDIIGVLSSDATYDEASKSLVAEATIFSHYAGMINEIAPHVGVSIRALATAEYGEMNGIEGDIITGFLKAESVDVVTHAGAGGAILQAIESARPKMLGSAPATTPIKETKMADTTVSLSADQASALTTAMTALTEALTREAAERQAAKDAREQADKPTAAAIATALAESGIPAVMYQEVTVAIESGTAVADAVKASKDRYDAIVAEARRSAGTPFVIGTPQSGSESGDFTAKLSEAEDAKFRRFVLGK